MDVCNSSHFDCWGHHRLCIIIMTTKKTYDIKKTLVKVGIVAAEILVAGVLAYIADKPALLILAPMFEGILDYIKHRDKK